MNAANDPQYQRKGASAAFLILGPLAVGLLASIAFAKLLWHNAPQIYMPLPGIPFTDRFFLPLVSIALPIALIN